MYLKPSLALLIALTGAIAMSYSAASAHMRVPMPHIVAPHIVAPHIVAPRVTPTIPVPPPHFTPRSTVIAKGGFGGSSNNGFGGSSNNNGLGSSSNNNGFGGSSNNNGFGGSSNNNGF